MQENDQKHHKYVKCLPHNTHTVSQSVPEVACHHPPIHLFMCVFILAFLSENMDNQCFKKRGIGEAAIMHMETQSICLVCHEIGEKKSIIRLISNGTFSCRFGNEHSGGGYVHIKEVNYLWKNF